MHPDHSAGLTDMATGKRNFPNAELVVHENEPRHWFDDAKMAGATERAKKLYFQAAREQTAPYKDRWRLFRQGEVFPGVTAIPRPGHTPGHTTFMVSSGKEQLLIWGDTVHVPEVQTARPEVCMEFDTDADGAAASRRKVFDMVATDRLLVTGMHLHFPGFAHLVRRGLGLSADPGRVGAGGVALWRGQVRPRACAAVSRRGCRGDSHVASGPASGACRKAICWRHARSSRCFDFGSGRLAALGMPGDVTRSCSRSPCVERRQP